MLARTKHMKEFTIINKFIESQPTPESLELGIGDDAAVFASTQSAQSMTVKMKSTCLDSSTVQSIPGSLKSLATLIEESKDILPKYLLLNLSITKIDDKWLIAYMTELNHLLRKHNLVLIGGDTTQGFGTVVYQLIGLKDCNHL